MVRQKLPHISCLQLQNTLTQIKEFIKTGKISEARELHTRGITAVVEPTYNRRKKVIIYAILDTFCIQHNTRHRSAHCQTPLFPRSADRRRS